MKKFRGKTLSGKVVSVRSGNNDDLSKDARGSLNAEIGGFAGDKHHGPTRKTWEADCNPRVRYAATSANGPVFQ